MLITPAPYLMLSLPMHKLSHGLMTYIFPNGADIKRVAFRGFRWFWPRIPGAALPTDTRWPRGCPGSPAPTRAAGVIRQWRPAAGRRSRPL